MKKVYINPDMNIVQLDFTRQILSSSITINMDDIAVDAGDAASRELDMNDESLFDDDDFFDEE